MQEMWSHLSQTYGQANDLEEKQRNLLAMFLNDTSGKVLELASGNAKVLQKIHTINPGLELTGIDYSADMIIEGKKNVPDVEFIQGDITQLNTLLQNKQFETIFCLNSLHNLPSKDFIYSILDAVPAYLNSQGYFIFDVRNAWNPFIHYGYSQNRKKGLSFWTLNYLALLRYAKKKGFKVKRVQGVYYQNRKESFFDSRFAVLNFLYTLYLKLTRITFFSPYIFIILQKK